MLMASIPLPPLTEVGASAEGITVGKQYMYRNDGRSLCCYQIRPRRTKVPGKLLPRDLIQPEFRMFNTRNFDIIRFHPDELQQLVELPNAIEEGEACIAGLKHFLEAKKKELMLHAQNE